MDGVGAFGHISRIRMFDALFRDASLRGLAPFVKKWYGIKSHFKWTDDEGVVEDIFQADGGEQGDALMPSLFRLALHPALQRIRARLPPGAEVIAYLDDIYIFSQPQDAVHIYDHVQTSLAEVCHIDVNLGRHTRCFE